jgi:pSer/pThr/pTyr-binding forkhead associated (FHA) protein
VVIIVRVESPNTPTGVELAFKNPERVLIGRDASSDVRLPDASVSQKHASLRRRGGGYAVVDENSSNGTYVNHIRLAAGASHLLSDGDIISVGRAALALRFAPDGAASAFSTQDLALAMVQGTLLAGGAETAPRLRVFEGPDKGRELVLEVDRSYVLGRDPRADLVLDDEDASRRHTRIARRGPRVWVTDLGSKNGTLLDGNPLVEGQPTLWAENSMLEIGKNQLSLDDPISSALRVLERVPDERLDVAQAGPPPVWQGATQSIDENVRPPQHTPAGQAAALDRSWSRPPPAVLPTPPPAPGDARALPTHTTSVSSSAPSAPIEPAPYRESESPAAQPPQGSRRWSSLDIIVVAVAAVTISASVLALAWFLTG